MVIEVERTFTVPEVAYVVGLSDKAVQREIDAGIVESASHEGTRAVSLPDLFYLAIVRDLRTSLAPDARARLRRAVTEASRHQEGMVRMGFLAARLDEVRDSLRPRLGDLDSVDVQIVSRPTIRAGEPVISGTRVPARLVAGLVRQGASAEELARDYALSPAQVAAATLFDRLHPKRGRPGPRPLDVVHHVPPDR